LIAFYPLGSVFYASFTDRAFASAREPQFVGLQNYSELLSMKIRELPAQIDPATGEELTDPETGETIYARPLDILPREPRRYKEAFQLGLFGNRYVVGATDPDFVLSIWDTLLFTFSTIALETLIGLGIALTLNSKFRGRGTMRAVMLVPWAIPTAVSSRMWEWMFGSTRTGFFNVVFQRLGLGDGQIPFLAQESWQLPAMIAIDVWKTTPFMALLLLAGLGLIPGELYEAANVDGASKWKQFTSITLPLLKPTLAVALVFRTLDALRVFDLFQIVLAQKKYSMASFAYYQLIDSQKMGYSSAASVVIFVIITIFAVIYIRLLRVTDD
ncbi:MAG TPA: sugar ABC transporter permease, partial [Acidimicrobiia bacterium]|nr:sugar ABC transporter permease [Acidimicrobiia bacterium]